MTKSTNWLAIIVAAVAGMGIGFLFYGTLFLDVWAAGNNLIIDEANNTMSRNGVDIEMSATPMIVNAIAMVLYALIMDWLVAKTNHMSWAKGATLGGIVGLAFFFSHYTQAMFAARPNMLGAVNGGYHLVLFIVIGAIVGGWRK
ncbi:MAG: DUF1761 domain-containing protein [Bacteroidota bacterium]